MQFIPFKETTTTINGETYVLMQKTHQILRQRRLELGMTQAQVADAAGILLRQYARIEGQEGAFRSSGAGIFLAVCAVLKLDPYMFFPEIKDNEKKETEPTKNPIKNSTQEYPSDVIHYPENRPDIFPCRNIWT